MLPSGCQGNIYFKLSLDEVKHTSAPLGLSWAYAIQAEGHHGGRRETEPDCFSNAEH